MAESVPDGTYKVVIAAVTSKAFASMAADPERIVTAVIIEGEHVGRVLRTTIKTSHRNFYLNVVEDVNELGERIVLADVRNIAETTATPSPRIQRVGPLDVPETIERFGRTYQLVAA